MKCSPPAQRDVLLRVVDAGLLATMFVAPLFFGGRHGLGQLVFVAIAAVTAVAWFARQALQREAPWARAVGQPILLLALGLVTVQVVPLPNALIESLAPRTGELLPLWTVGNETMAATPVLGQWNTLTLTPSETRASLAILLGYALLFTTALQRIERFDDARRLLRWSALAAVAMAAFGMVQYFTSNGLFFWFYDYPFTDTAHAAKGSFTNKNHFAQFLVLGTGPLLAWLVVAQRASGQPHRRSHKSTSWRAGSPTARGPVHLLAAAVLLVVLAVLFSYSRGAAAALVAAGTVFVAICWSRGFIGSKQLVAGGGAVVLVIGVLSIYGYERVADRLDDLASGSLHELDRHAGRRTIWAANLEAIRAGGFFGSGTGSHRSLNPVYLNESLPKEFTHAENGYLQVVTENGLAGAVLLVGALVFGTISVVRAVVLSDKSERTVCTAAIAASCTGCLVHSLVDFVWYVPACMSILLILLAVAARLPALSDTRTASASAGTWSFSRPRWIEAAAVTAIAGGWAIFTLVGPAIGAVHWDRYLQASIAREAILQNQIKGDSAGNDEQLVATNRVLADEMVNHLQNVLRWNPRHARAQLRLSRRLIEQFELSQDAAANAMSVAQIREAALASQFPSADALHAWLQRAFGENAQRLSDAHRAARAAASLNPLDGETYVTLAQLCFLEGASPSAVDSYLQQALRVRPHDGDVLFEVGKERLLANDMDGALGYWQQAYHSTGRHQTRIVQLLAGRLPAEQFVDVFQPDWRTLNLVWTRFREMGQPEDWPVLVTHAHRAAEREVPNVSFSVASGIWLHLSVMYRDINHSAGELAALEAAHRNYPSSYTVRSRLGNLLAQQGRHDEAEPHLRWCLARRPQAQNVRTALRNTTQGLLR